jgi:hypothetical protein
MQRRQSDHVAGHAGAACEHAGADIGVAAAGDVIGFDLDGAGLLPHGVVVSW